MKIIVIRLIATFLFGLAVFNYMSQNSSIYKHFLKKQIEYNKETPIINQS